MEAWQVSRDGRQVHCVTCAAGLAVTLDDVVLFWPPCGHATEHAEVLYDRAVCLVCTGG
jgi:hypothetical protein